MEQSAVSALGALLDRLAIRWVLIGALAANRYRMAARLTQAVDLLLLDTGPGLDVLREELERIGWELRWTSPEQEMIRLRHPELGPADLMVAATDYQRQAMARARVEALDDGSEARVLAPEDVIVHKLIADRTQDIADIEAILAAGVALDDGYIRHWAEFWEVADRWHSLRG